MRVKKLGSYLADDSDILYRTGQANKAIYMMNKLWLQYRYISMDTRIKYNACVKPLLHIKSAKFVVIFVSMYILSSFLCLHEQSCWLH